MLVPLIKGLLRAFGVRRFLRKGSVDHEENGGQGEWEIRWSEPTHLPFLIRRHQDRDQQTASREHQ